MRPAAAGTAAPWQAACAAAGSSTASHDDTVARAFFETWFVPYRLTSSAGDEGLFTGYYEPLLEGARRPDARYRYPLYKRPADLVAVDLGAFDPGLEGKRIAGRVEDRRLVPYPDRAAIDAGALADRGLELLWVADPVALFFLHIQGSGQVQLDSGERIRVGFAEQNGRAYRAIGHDLVEAGELDSDTLSLQSIRDWLRTHPDRAQGLMERNPSYVFFRELGPVDKEIGPRGAAGVALTPGRSIAIDRRYVPLGAPVWIETTAPYSEGERPLHELLVAQDTGGAIKGVVRGDVFWGAGELAEYVAGHMKSRGRWFILLPRAIAPVS